MELLLEWDRRFFLFLNATISTAPGDILWPLITDYDRLVPVRIALLTVWLLLLWKGGRTGRTVALLVIPLLILTDQLSSTLIKNFVGRVRPCGSIDGVPVVSGVHLLVDCGPGKSFPSSHAVNNFALAVLFSHYYRPWTWAFFTWAGLVAFSRVAVGVHFPLDAAGGALIGTLLAAGVIRLWRAIERRVPPPLGLTPRTGGDA